MKLKAYLVMHGITMSEIAKQIQITKQAMSLKINGKTSFKEWEIKGIYDYLKSKDESLQIEDIFF